MTTKRPFVILQSPNPPLVIATGFWVLAKLVVTSGTLHNYLTFGFGLALLVWALLEVFKGVNWLRRVLGLIGLYFAISALAAPFIN